MNHANYFIDEFEERIVYDKIECHLIGCVSVMCNTIKQSQDPKIKNVTVVFNMYY